ncbi:beta-Ala-His dipeptidase [Teratosphaeria nubilosa]|uniref:Beta-Ala-His dipeptidase n=1 Tax=Teratosphaeria nubilosa TaxID=161662 RepID=A0A6G1L1Q5_9PEZI|nr:beta-Ala-His dipeptidase [Teratosphaeria nubilosa]
MEQDLLFSSAGDRTVNAWSTKDYKRQFCLHSNYDVGDIFCVSYSPTLRTVYLGAQNTSIQWATRKLQPQAQRSDYFSGARNDPFFDSAGPGGYMTPRQIEVPTLAKDAVGGETIQIPKDNIKHFAHYGYVFSMQIVTHIPEAGGREVLVTGGGDGVVKLWRLHPETGGIGELYTLDDGREEGHSILSLAIEGTFLYSGRSGGEVDVWDLETRQLVRNLKAHRDDVLTICVGGGFMFSAAVTGFVRKFDNRQYTLKSRFQAHEGRILSSAFTVRKGRPIYVTGGNDNSVAVWNTSDCVTLPVANARTSNEQLFECLRRFVSYRTVSSDSRYQVDCRRAASYLRSVLKNFGATTEMLPTSEPYNPVIYARFRGNPSTAAKRKKILFYGHYDVVPADNSTSKWLISDPFAMEGIDGYLYGRGTSDNKGPIMAAIFACAELLSSQQLESDIIFLIEGEEECGSRGFEAAVKAGKEKIGHVDWILLANSYWLDDRIPCLTYGLRGVIHATVQIESSHPDLHSGVDGSRQLDESLKDLVMLLSKLTGKDGEVMIPGFYDPIPELSSEEAALYDEITAALVQRNPNLGDREDLAKSLMRRWREATLTIHRFQTSGPDNATIIPRLAKVALSMRLVPNQESAVVAKSLTDFLQSEFAKLGSNNSLTVTIDHQAEPWLGDWTNDLFKCLEEAIMDVWGPIGSSTSSSSSSASQTRPSPAALKLTVPDTDKINGTGYFTKISPTTSSVLANGSLATPSLPPMSPLTEVSNRLTNITTSSNGAPSTSHSQGSRRKPLYIREGGSIPAIRFLEQTFNAPAAHLPCGQASDSAHLDSERLRLRNLYAAKRIFGRVFGELPRR